MTGFGRASAMIAAAVTAAFLVAVALGIGAPAAVAHDDLAATDPADGSTVAALPREVTLTFTGTVLDDPAATRIRVTDAAGRSLADGAARIQDATVVQELRPMASAPGRVTVLWRVVSQDGHPVSGEFRFTATGPTGASASPGAATSPVATAAPTGSDSPTTSGSTRPPASARPPSPAVWIVLGAATIAAITVVGYLLVSRTRRPAGPRDDGSDDPSTADSGPASDR